MVADYSLLVLLANANEPARAAEAVTDSPCSNKFRELGEFSQLAKAVL
jgi:hypothetical protein